MAADADLELRVRADQPLAERLHRTFADALRATYGKLPVAGIPRISRMRPGQGRFTLVDVAGNSLIFVRADADGEPQLGPPTHTHLDKALRIATRLRDFKNDDPAAARVLDAALRRPDRGVPLERARVLAARIELAVTLDDSPRAAAARAELESLPLSDAERAELPGESS